MEFNRKDLYWIVTLTLNVWAFISLLQIPLGIAFADHRDCSEPKPRIEYVFPAFRLGCWLGEVPGDKK